MAKNGQEFLAAANATLSLALTVAASVASAPRGHRFVTVRSRCHGPPSSCFVRYVRTNSSTCQLASGVAAIAIAARTEVGSSREKCGPIGRKKREQRCENHHLVRDGEARRGNCRSHEGSCDKQGMRRRAATKAPKRQRLELARKGSHGSGGVGWRCTVSREGGYWTLSWQSRRHATEKTSPARTVRELCAQCPLLLNQRCF